MPNFQHQRSLTRATHQFQLIHSISLFGFAIKTQDKQDLLGVVFLDEEAGLGFELFGSGSFV